jgi:hypothetical protein
MNKADIKLNGFSVFFSGLCILHCVLMPSLILYLPTSLFTTTHTKMVHYLIIFINITLSVYSFIKTHKKVKSSNTLKLILTGYGFYITALSLDLFITNHEVEDGLFILGSSFLVFGHFINHKNCCTK